MVINMKKILNVLALIPLSMLLTSCVGEEPDNIAYITALGIDKAENGYVYTIQFANPNKISGGAAEEGGKGGEIVENIAVEAPTVYSAINNANGIVSKDLSLSHAKIFVVSEEMAKDGLNGINDVFVRNNDIRPDLYIAVAENAGKYLEEISPTIELNPVKYYQLTYENKKGSAIPQNTAFDFYISCVTNESDCVLPLAGVAKTKEKAKESGSSGGGDGGTSGESEENESQKKSDLNIGGFEDGVKNYIAGQAGTKIKNKSEALGIAVFKNDALVGKLGSTDALIYNILTNKFLENNISFYSGAAPKKPITVQLEQKKKNIYNIDKDKKRVKIKLYLEGELLSASREHISAFNIGDTEKSMEKMTNEAAVAFLDKVYHEMGADSIGIRGKLKNKFLSMESYGEYIKDFNAADWTFEVESEVKIKRTGMIDYL